MPISVADSDEHAPASTPERTPPATLYKYMTFDTARKVLFHRTLRFNSPLRFNDPFDMQWDALWTLGTPPALEHRRSVLTQAIQDPTCWPTETSEQVRASLRREHDKILRLPEDQQEVEIQKTVRALIGDEEAVKQFKQVTEDICRRCRAFCVSQEPDNVLMWSHYASDHHGIVLGFDTSTMISYLRKREIVLKRVEYCDTLPDLVDHEQWTIAEVFDLPRPQMRGHERWALSKHTGWSYEKEWRFGRIEPEGTNGFFIDIDLCQEAITEITSGYRTDPADFDYLLQLARKINPDINCFKMSPHPSAFRLEKHPIEPPPPG